jgi:hypothetical protein
MNRSGDFECQPFPWRSCRLPETQGDKIGATVPQKNQSLSSCRAIDFRDDDTSYCEWPMVAPKLLHMWNINLLQSATVVRHQLNFLDGNPVNGHAAADSAAERLSFVVPATCAVRSSGAVEDRSRAARNADVEVDQSGRA